MLFPGIRLVEQTEQKFCCIRICPKEKKRVTVIVGLFCHIKAPTEKLFDFPVRALDLTPTLF